VIRVPRAVVKLGHFPEFTCVISVPLWFLSGRGSGASTAAAPASAPVPEEDVEGPQTSALTSSCVICFDAAFDREGFSDKTVLICDQCEREYHVSEGGDERAGGHSHH
jgi:hypothetical protein